MNNNKRNNNNRKIIGIIITLSLVLFIVIIKTTISKKETIVNKTINIEEVLQTKAYSYLPEEAKNYIRKVYNETGNIILTEKNKKKNQSYLNPDYVEYLKNSEVKTIVPNPTRYDFIYNIYESQDNLPNSFDLRNVDGKNFVTPFKNQKGEGLCWAFASTSLLESHLLYKNNKPYDETAEIFSEKQIDYATAANSTHISNGLYNNYRSLTTAGNFVDYEEILMDGLGAVYKSWEAENSLEILSTNKMDNSEIYSLENSNYELNESIYYPFLSPSTSEEEKNAYNNNLKKLVMTNGGAFITTDVTYYTYNYYGPSENEFVDSNDNWIPVIDININDHLNYISPHALEVIGWDDNIEYKICSAASKKKYYSTTESCGNDGVYREGKGVWILKNSWGADNPLKIMYMTYESQNNNIFFIKEVGKRTWDNFDHLHSSNNSDGYYYFDTHETINEKINKIKIKLPSIGNYNIYISQNGGTSFDQIATFDNQYNGVKTIDLSSKNIIVNNNTIFKVLYDGEAIILDNMNVYTNNINNQKIINTKNIIYGIESELYNSEQTYDFQIFSKTKNIAEKTPLSIKIKDSNNNYLDANSYSIKHTKTYANTNNAKLTIVKDDFPKGNYTIEVCAENDCTNSELIIQNDFLTTLGNGSRNNPWQITNAREFNLIRKYPNDSFILMNDIDFEYDTKNPNGIIYNDGKGFIPIEQFTGYLNGNNYKIKNIYINNNNAALFSSLFINSSCRFDKCGVENLQVYNPKIIGKYSASAIANIINVTSSQHFALNNNASINGSIESSYLNNSLAAGLYSEINLYNSNDYIINKLFNSSKIVSNKGNTFGLIGKFGIIDETGTGYVYGNINIEDSINVGKIECDNCSSTGIFKPINDDNIVYNYKNIISINNDIPLIDLYYDTNTNIENVYSTSSKLLDIITTKYDNNNILLNLSNYEVANSNYSNWEGFNNNWYQYKEDGVNRIPVLKNIDYEYFKPNQNIVSVDVGSSLETSSIFDNATIMTSCSYNVLACNYQTDNSIVNIEDTTITGIKKGSTKIIVANESDGFIKTVDVKVGNINLVTFVANGGTGIMTEQEIETGTTTKLKKNTFTNGNHTFSHWNTKANDTGTSYTDEQEINSDKDLVLYAIWNYKKYTIKYDANGGTGTMTNQIFLDGESQNLIKNSFEKELYEFDHWNTKADDSGDSYSNEEIIFVTKDMTLFAIYRLVAYNKITFDSNGGEDLQPLFVKEEDIIELPRPTKKGYMFGGWYKDKELNNRFWDETPINSDITLYASWFDIYVTWELNGGQKSEDFEIDKYYQIGAEIDLLSPEEMRIKPPDGKVLDHYQIYGTRYLVGQKFKVTSNQDGMVTINCIWKNQGESINEKYEVTFKQTSSSSFNKKYNEVENQLVASNKEQFEGLINSFKNGKQDVKIANYDDLFGDNYYSSIQWFQLDNIIENDTGKIYKYIVNYKKVTILPGKKVEYKYYLNKTEEKESKIENTTDIYEYINNKKRKFLEQVNGVNVDNLFIIDKDSKDFQYAELLEVKPRDSVYKSEFEKYLINYDCNYSLVKINLNGKKEYILSKNDNTITFWEEDNKDFNIFIENLIDSNDKAIQDKINRQKEKIFKDQKLIGYYKIEVKNNLEELHTGPFKLQLKLNEEMKRYKKYYMVYISDNKEEPIEFTKADEYIIGTLNHLSEYALIGLEETEQKIENPTTIDNILPYLNSLFVVSIVIIILRVKRHNTIGNFK